MSTRRRWERASSPEMIVGSERRASVVWVGGHRSSVVRCRDVSRHLLLNLLTSDHSLLHSVSSSSFPFYGLWAEIQGCFIGCSLIDAKKCLSFCLSLVSTHSFSIPLFSSSILSLVLHQWCCPLVKMPYNFNE